MKKVFAKGASLLLVITFVFTFAVAVVASATTSIDGDNYVIDADEKLTITEFDNFVIELRNDQDYTLKEVQVEVEVQGLTRVSSQYELEPGQTLEIDLSEVVNRGTLEKNFFSAYVGATSTREISAYIVGAMVVLILFVFFVGLVIYLASA